MNIFCSFNCVASTSRDTGLRLNGVESNDVSQFPAGFLKGFALQLYPCKLQERSCANRRPSSIYPLQNHQKRWVPSLQNRTKHPKGAWCLARKKTSKQIRGRRMRRRLVMVAMQLSFFFSGERLKDLDRQSGKALLDSEMCKPRE